jgi:hypothetical protein
MGGITLPAEHKPDKPKIVEEKKIIESIDIEILEDINLVDTNTYEFLEPLNYISGAMAKKISSIYPKISDLKEEILICKNEFHKKILGFGPKKTEMLSKDLGL